MKQELSRQARAKSRDYGKSNSAYDSEEQTSNEKPNSSRDIFCVVKETQNNNTVPPTNYLTNYGEREFKQQMPDSERADRIAHNRPASGRTAKYEVDRPIHYGAEEQMTTLNSTTSRAGSAKYIVKDEGEDLPENKHEVKLFRTRPGSARYLIQQDEAKRARTKSTDDIEKFDINDSQNSDTVETVDVRDSAENETLKRAYQQSINDVLDDLNDQLDRELETSTLRKSVDDSGLNLSTPQKDSQLIRQRKYSVDGTIDLERRSKRQGRENIAKKNIQAKTESVKLEFEMKETKEAKKDIRKPGSIRSKSEDGRVKSHETAERHAERHHRRRENETEEERLERRRRHANMSEEERAERRQKRHETPEERQERRRKRRETETEEERKERHRRYHQRHRRRYSSMTEEERRQHHRRRKLKKQKSINDSLHVIPAAEENVFENHNDNEIDEKIENNDTSEWDTTASSGDDSDGQNPDRRLGSLRPNAIKLPPLRLNMLPKRPTERSQPQDAGSLRKSASMDNIKSDSVAKHSIEVTKAKKRTAEQTNQEDAGKKQEVDSAQMQEGSQIQNMRVRRNSWTGGNQVSLPSVSTQNPRPSSGKKPQPVEQSKDSHVNQSFFTSAEFPESVIMSTSLDSNLFDLSADDNVEFEV